MKRRTLLQGTAAGAILAASPDSVVSANADAALFEALALCNAVYDEADRIGAECEKHPEDSPAWRGLAADQWDAIEKARDLYLAALQVPAQTVKGLHAKIKAMDRAGVISERGLDFPE